MTKQNCTRYCSHLNMENAFFYTALLIYSVAFVYFFAQNFVLSEDLNLLAFREVDDLAFQCTLRRVHSKLNLRNWPLMLTQSNDYAYGWIFWFPMVVVTYPFYFLSVHCDIHTPLIVIPRQISLLFSFATAYVVYKIFSLYTKDRILKSTALIIFLCYPTFGYFTQRFGTVAQTMFFASLALYITLRTDQINYKSLTKIAVALAASAGTKFSGLLIAPLIGMLIADKVNWKVNAHNVKMALYFLCLVLGLSLILSNPSLLFAVFKPSILSQYITTISSQVRRLSHASAENQDWFYKLENGIVLNTCSWAIFVVLFGALIASAFIEHKHRWLAYCAVSITFAILYLFSTVSLGCFYITLYFSVLSYVLLFGLLLLNQSRKVIRNSACILISVYAIYYMFTKNSYISYNQYFVSIESNSLQTALKARSQLMSYIPKPSGDKVLHIFRDFDAPATYSGLVSNVRERIFYNTSKIKNSLLHSPFDFILLSKTHDALREGDAWRDLLANSAPELQATHLENRKELLGLFNTGEFLGHRYSKLVEINGITLFAKR